MSRLASSACAVLVALALPTVAADPLKGDGAVQVPPGFPPSLICLYVDPWGVPPVVALRDCDKAAASMAANATEGTAARPLFGCVSFDLGPPLVLGAACQDALSGALP